jgi:nucleoside-diphosphate-sugar epimerase
MRILITGGSGFIGSAVIRELRSAEHTILGISRSAQQVEEGVQWMQGSLTVTDELLEQIRAFRPEVLIHLAWENIPDFSFAMSVQNLENQVRFLDAVFSLGSLRKIITTGSCFEYNNKTGPCNETDICISTNYFTWAKNTLRDYIRMEAERLSIAHAWLRVFYVYGPGQRSGSLIPTIIRNLQSGEMPAIRNPRNANDFIYVDDLAESIRRFSEKDFRPGIYNAGSGSATPVLEVMRIVEQQLTSGNTFTNQLSKASAEVVQEMNAWADMQRTTEALQWKPATTPEAGIQAMLSVQKEFSQFSKQ